MVIKGLQHLLEIARVSDSKMKERFRYSLRRTGNPEPLYWGEERTREAAAEMGILYLRLADRCATRFPAASSTGTQESQMIPAVAEIETALPNAGLDQAPTNLA